MQLSLILVHHVTSHLMLTHASMRMCNECITSGEQCPTTYRRDELLKIEWTNSLAAD